ncbi:MAG: glycosyltransferase family 2 protein [Patescibacteria group bacterium]
MIYIIILTWNGIKYLPKLFESLAGLDYPKEKTRILVIDSGSTDGSREYLEKLDNIHLIKLDKNLGFVKGNNVGMQYALDHGAKYIVLLNQDIEVEPDFLNYLVNTANSNEKIGIVQPLILYYKNRNEINSYGNKLHYLGYGYCEGNHALVSSVQCPVSSVRVSGCQEITYASAAAVLYKAEMLKKIGLFDENIFAYHEDSEICLRARLKGYLTYLEPRSIIYHDYFFPTTKNKNRYFLMEKNRLYIIFKFYKLKTILLILPMIWFMDLGQIYFSIKNKFFFEFIKSRLWFIFNFREFYKARNKIQKNRQIGDRELTKDFVSEILYQEISNPLLDKIANPIMKMYWKFIKKLVL